MRPVLFSLAVSWLEFSALSSVHRLGFRVWGLGFRFRAYYIDAVEHMNLFETYVGLILRPD